MDGIPVKISEKYKPPRKITLPASIQNKFNSEIKFDQYDFELEHYVAEQMTKLKDHREQKKTSDLKAEEQPVNSKLEENMTQTNVLTPIPMKPYVPSSISNKQAIGGINISDFENDTSSPFDSVELKTINDMEELAHVLGETQLTSSEKWSSIENGCNMQNWCWGSNYPMQPHMPIYSSPSTTENDSLRQQPVQKVDDETTIILQDLQRRIAERKAAMLQERKDTSNSSSLSIAAGVSCSEKIVEKKKETLPNPISSLSPQCASIARSIGEMGFPIARAARATEIFGPDEPKVIEYLLEVQSLEEAGYPGERAERAFVLCKYSRKDAAKFLNNLVQIMRLGFTEEKVTSALVKTGNNRDKALDSLIS